jgi:hypothetical protein
VSLTDRWEDTWLKYLVKSLFKYIVYNEYQPVEYSLVSSPVRYYPYWYYPALYLGPATW